MILTAQEMFNVINWACDKFKEKFPLEYQQLRDINQFEWYLNPDYNTIYMMLDNLIVIKLRGKYAIAIVGDTYIEYKILEPVYYKKTYFEPLKPYSCIDRIYQRHENCRSNLELLQFILQNHNISLNDSELSFADLYRKYQENVC